MTAELVLSAFLVTTQPLYLNEPGPPHADVEVRLAIERRAGVVYFAVEPYVIGNGINMGRAGAELELGLRAAAFSLGWYHHSIHNLDVAGDVSRVDGVRLRIRLD